jgi:EAL domain-containing protein (putative c-di-GMP-specific phosphodiesterase class I)
LRKSNSLGRSSQACGKTHAKARFCKLVVELVRSLGSKPVAVGLESAADAKKIAELGCEIGQVHFFWKTDAFERNYWTNQEKVKKWRVGDRLTTQHNPEP